MPIDVRLPIGTLFLILGVILAVYGALTGAFASTPTMAGHLDFVWGSIMAIFGATLAWFGQRANARRE